jgi:site-specific DNA recombinase
MKTAAIYARVSSDQQKEEKTIASQTAALVEFARSEGYSVPDEWVFQDEGYRRELGEAGAGAGT